MIWFANFFELFLHWRLSNVSPGKNRSIDLKISFTHRHLSSTHFYLLLIKRKSALQRNPVLSIYHQNVIIQLRLIRKYSVRASFTTEACSTSKEFHMTEEYYSLEQCLSFGERKCCLWGKPWSELRKIYFVLPCIEKKSFPDNTEKTYVSCDHLCVCVCE